MRAALSFDLLNNSYAVIGALVSSVRFPVKTYTDYLEAKRARERLIAAEKQLLTAITEVPRTVFALEFHVIDKRGGAFAIALIVSLALSILFVATGVLGAFVDFAYGVMAPFIVMGTSLLGVYFYCALLVTRGHLFARWNIPKSAVMAILIVTSANFVLREIFSVGGFHLLFQSDCRNATSYSMLSVCLMKSMLAAVLLNISIWLPPVAVIELLRLTKFWRANEKCLSAGT